MVVDSFHSSARYFASGMVSMFCGERLPSELSVEGLNDAVLPVWSRGDERGINAGGVAPLEEGRGGEFGSVVT